MKRVVLLVVVLMIIKISSVFSQSDKYKALFIYNFTKYIEWPTNQNGDFVIAVLGNSPIINEIEDVAKNKTVGSQKIVVNHYSSIEEVNDCNILFLPANKTGKLEEVKTKCNSHPILIVTDKKGAAQSGADINFVLVDGKQKFEINGTNIAKSGLKVNTGLLNLGIKVI